MDETFWSSVVKRWSDASENVIKLKKEVARLEEERKSHRCSDTRNSNDDVPHLVAELSSPEPAPSTTRPRAPKHRVERSVQQGPNHPTETPTFRDELEDAAIGIGKAKEEYRKLQQDLAASSKRITELIAENHKLAEDHRQEVIKLREEYQNTITERRIRKFQSLAEIVEPGGIFKESSLNTAFRPSYIAGVDDVDKLKRQIEALKRSVDASEAEKHELRRDLILSKEKLHKAELNIRTLLASIVKLQAVARLPGKTNSQHDTDYSHYARSRKSSNQSNSKPIPKNLHLTAKAAINDSQFSVLSALPLERKKDLDKLPSLPNICKSDNKFNRAFLKYILGEGIQSLVDHLTGSSRVIDKNALVSSYLCPTLDHHPWCPSTPGKHGFIFSGFGEEKDSYTNPAIRNVFVGLPKAQGEQRIFQYLGKYRVCRTRPLTPGEWTSLSDETKVLYANITRTKGNDNRTANEVVKAYSNGEIRIPCLQLECIGFDHDFYRALATCVNSWVNPR